MGKRTIKQQLMNVISTRHNFGRGRKKHQDKLNGDNKDKDIIYSSTEADSLKDFASDFSGWVKEKHPELWRTELTEVSVDIGTEFFKTKSHCSQNTINSYKERWNKIFRCAQATYKNTDFESMKYIEIPLSERDKNQTLRDITFDREVHDAAIKKMAPGSGARKGNILNGILGTRVKETVNIRYKDLDLQSGTVFIAKGKGGKPRTIQITKEQINIIKKEVLGDGIFKPNQTLCGCSTEAVQKGLTRAIERLDKEHGTNFAQQLKDKKTSVHAGRKMVATERYNKDLAQSTVNLIYGKILRDGRNGKINLANVTKRDIIRGILDNLDGAKEKYLTEKEKLRLEAEAWSRTSILLGHGPNRPELKAVYIITDSTKILSFL